MRALVWARNHHLGRLDDRDCVLASARYSDNRGTSSTTTSTSTYASVADAVDEVAVIPPRFYVLGTTSSQTGTAGMFASSTTHGYDASRRLTQIVSVSGAGVATTTYTAWDGSGRPTAGTDVGPGFNHALAITYDNNARTRTILVLGLTNTETFDANGNTIRYATAGVSTNVITVNQTQRICK